MSSLVFTASDGRTTSLESSCCVGRDTTKGGIQDRLGIAHSIDFHAVFESWGGSHTNTFDEQSECQVSAHLLQIPDLFVYHCVTAPIPVHIHKGRFGLILVEPAECLPPVVRALQVMQHEMYLQYMEKDPKQQQYEMYNEAASTYNISHDLLNGLEGSFRGESPTKRPTGGGRSGSNIISSFHLTGGISDKVYREGDLVLPPLRDIQITLVPAGGSAVVELPSRMEQALPGRQLILSTRGP